LSHLVRRQRAIPREGAGRDGGFIGEMQEEPAVNDWGMDADQCEHGAGTERTQGQEGVARILHFDPAPERGQDLRRAHGVDRVRQRAQTNRGDRARPEGARGEPIEQRCPEHTLPAGVGEPSSVEERA
jgi:hypothetical protein